ncbi:hypothetical protein GCM10023185_14390 [Hymenobacter saemangeumensis]|uniref:DUF3575 domain-containing protein n=2 Tax=Hymenobacter saemangeumensis TaxID=1084522 RepID=A0ABP8I8J8_9BACT
MPADKLYRRNIVRFDLLSPLAYNISNSLFDNGLVCPVLVSYERQLNGQWSLGAEALFNGGERTNRRSGAALMARYYTQKTGATAGMMTGFYVSPVVSYRAVSAAYLLDGNLLTHGKRAGTGLLAGYQLPLGKPGTSRLALDASMGLLYWNRLGTDRTDVDPARPGSTGPDLKQTGLIPDFRLGVGIKL